MDLSTTHQLILKRKNDEKVFRAKGKSARIEIEQVYETSCIEISRLDSEISRLDRLLAGAIKDRKDVEMHVDAAMDKLNSFSVEMDRQANIERENVRRLEIKVLEHLRGKFSNVLKDINENNKMYLRVVQF